MTLQKVPLLTFAVVGMAAGGSHRFIQAPIRISDFSGLRAFPLSEPIIIDSPHRSYTQAQNLQRTLPQIISLRPKFQEETRIDPTYNFGYSVSDSLTGDTKTREESRDGDVVTGSYSVADPDGRIRTVTYTADAENGFQAKVTYDGKEGPVSIPQKSKKPSLKNPSLFSQIQPDSNAVIVEARNIRGPAKVRSESVSLLHPVSIPRRRVQGLRRPLSFQQATHFITPDGRIISASLN